MKLVLLSGGVGGARLARGLAAVENLDLTVVVNVADDEQVYGLMVSPDLDTVVYTLAEVEGPEGWGVRNDSWTVMDALTRFPIDTTFRIGDRDLATNLYRTERMAAGVPLSAVTAEVVAAMGLWARILPATDQRVRTRVLTGEGEWLSFQDYFVRRRHTDEVRDVRFEGAAEATPAPGVLEALREADAVVVGTSNPVLSIWPILAVPGIAEALEAAPRVVGVSPLFAGHALKGPADKVLASLGFPEGNRGVVEAYADLLSDLVVDTGDAGDADLLADRLTVHVTDTRISDPARAAVFGQWLVSRL